MQAVKCQVRLNLLYPAAVALGAVSLCLLAERVSAEALPQSNKIDELRNAKSLIAVNSAENGGTIWFKQGTQPERLLVKSKLPLYLPTISPDGNWFAFLTSTSKQGDNSLDGADAELVVADFDGHVQSKALINPLHDGEGQPQNTVHLQGIQKVWWMSGGRVAISGIATAEKSLGDIVTMTPSIKEWRIPFDDERFFGFKDDGPEEISPSGGHIATVMARGSKAAKECADANERLQIDGQIVPMPQSTKPFAVVAHLAWRNETELSTVVRTATGLKLLTLRNVPIKVIGRISQSPFDDMDGSDFVNPPTVSLADIPESLGKIGATFEVRYDAGVPMLERYSATSGRLTDLWNDQNDAFARIPVPAAQTVVVPGKMLFETQRILDSLDSDLRQHMSSMNSWCRGPGCGGLSSNSPEASVGEPPGAAVPANCAGE